MIQDYCEWCGEDATELDTMSTCSVQCQHERAQALVEKWKDVMYEPDEVNSQKLKTSVILESEECWLLPTRAERIAKIKERYKENHEAYILRKWAMIGDINTVSDKNEKVLLIEAQERCHKV